MSAFTGTVGLEHRLTWQDETGAPIDLTGKTLSVRVRTPVGTMVTYDDADVERIDTATGTAKVTTGATDLEFAGTYKLQGQAEENGNTYMSDIVTFVVQRSLPVA